MKVLIYLLIVSLSFNLLFSMDIKDHMRTTEELTQSKIEAYNLSKSLNECINSKKQDTE